MPCVWEGLCECTFAFLSCSCVLVCLNVCAVLVLGFCEVVAGVYSDENACCFCCFFFPLLSSPTDLMSGMMEQSGKQCQCEGLIRQTQKSDEHENRQRHRRREREEKHRQRCILAGVS